MDILKLKQTINSLPQPYILVLVGPPLSGKDTVLNQLDLQDVEVISRDQVLLDVYGSDDYNKAFQNVDQKEVDRELINKIKESYLNKSNTIINMTNMTRKRRVYNLSFFPKDYYKVAIIFPRYSEIEYERRNNKRRSEENKFIPPHVLQNMISSFQEVTKAEGFNKIIQL